MSEHNLHISQSHEQEYKIIKHDLIRLIILNIIYLAGLLTLYYTNQQSHYLDKWLFSILKF